MTMKNDEKSEGELTCHFKIDIRNLTNLDSITLSLNKLHFNGLLKKYRRVIFHDSDAKFGKKLTWGLENDIRNLTKFHRSTQKSQNWDFY